MKKGNIDEIEYPTFNGRSREKNEIIWRCGSSARP
jgi:hypothetical protein